MSGPFEALGAAQLTGEALKRFLANNEVANLFGLVSADVRKSSLVPGEAADAVVDRLNGLLVQPNIAGPVKRWLETGDSSVREPLKAAFAELFNFDAHGIPSDALSALVVAAIEANLPRAKRNERDAAHLDQQMTRDLIQESARELQDQIAEMPAAPAPAAIGSKAIRVARAMVDLPPSQADIVEKLVAENPEEAGPLQEALEAGGPTRIADAIDQNAPWLQDSIAAVWEAAGRLSDSIGRNAEARRAYERAADHPGVHDRVRQLVRASHSAAADGDAKRAAELFEKARQADDRNPAVLLHEARNDDNPAHTLALLDEIIPTDSDQEGLAECIRAEALIRQNQFVPAREAIARARGLRVDQRATDELDGVATLTEAHLSIAEPQRMGPEPLLAAADNFKRLYAGARESECWDAAGVFLGRAAVALVLGASADESAQLLDEALADARLRQSVEARRVLAEGAMLLRRFADVRTLLGESTDETDRLELAAAHVMGRDSDIDSAIIDELRVIMESGHEEAPRAAYILLCASSNDVAVEWNSTAEKIVAEINPNVALMLRAFRLDTEGDLDAVETHLLPHTDNPDALRHLILLARRRENHEKAVSLSETLLDRTAAPGDQLLLAGALANAGQRDKAVDRLLGVGRNQQAGLDDRRSGYAQAANLLQDAERFRDLESIAHEWAACDQRSDPRWATVLALTMQFRQGDALRAWRELGELDPDTQGRAELLAEVFGSAADPVEGVEMVARLSDRYSRPERLEVALIFTALRREIPEGALPATLEARLRDSFETFPQRFPDSRAIRTVAIDLDDPIGSLMRAIGSELEARERHTSTRVREVRWGNAAVALLASASGCSTGETLFMLEALPLTYPDDQFNLLDRTDAAAALAGGAVWDSNAIFVVAALGGVVEQTLRNVLPSSVVARATQIEIAGDFATADANRVGGISITHGHVHFGEWTESERASNFRRATEMHRLATALPTHVLAEDDSSDELIKVVRGEAPTPAKAWAATLAAAQTTGFAVFSDDRAVRRSAREVGLPTFGTAALLDVLVDRDLLAEDIRDDVRRRLLAHGAWGVRHTVEEIAQIARDANWQPTAGTRAALGDTTAWLALMSAWMDRVIRFLDIVFAEAPAEMDNWVHRAIDAVTHDVGGNYEAHAQSLLLGALDVVSDPPRMSETGLAALISALRRMRYFEVFPPGEDLLITAVARTLTITNDPLQQATLFRRALARVGPAEQELLRARFVR